MIHNNINKHLQQIERHHTNNAKYGETLSHFIIELKDTMSTKVIRMMAPWLKQGKLEILSGMLKEWLLYQ